MGKTTRILSVVLGGLLVFGAAACKKKAAPERPQTLEEGVEQLRAALVTASPEVESRTAFVTPDARKP